MLEPVKKSRWSPLLAAHLLNRAGFGASPETIEAFASLSPQDAVGRLLQTESGIPRGPEWTLAPDADARPERDARRGLSEAERQELRRQYMQQQGEHLVALRHWWLERMRRAPNPLVEKLTLFWHGHFASSFEKVRSAYALYQQNQTFRRFSMGNWRDFIVAVSQDPAMLIYLDNARSKKGHPNENYARELMELFTLGEGRYTEKDVLEAARAFTGWGIAQERMAFEEHKRLHDDGRKEFLGTSGSLDGHDVIDQILKQDACAVFIASKLWRYFAFDDVPSDLANELGRTLRQNKYEFRPLLERMFLSREFYSTESAYGQIKSPVQWLVGSCIALDAPLPNADACGMILRSLGQELFAPPNVKGWIGGFSWITTASLMQRYNLAGFLVKGSGDMLGRKTNNEDMMMQAMTEMRPQARERASLRSMPSLADADRILPAGKRTSKEEVWAFLEWRLYQRKLDEAHTKAARDYLDGLPEPGGWTPDQVRDLVHVMMCTPYYQVC